MALPRPPSLFYPPRPHGHGSTCGCDGASMTCSPATLGGVIAAFLVLLAGAQAVLVAAFVRHVRRATHTHRAAAAARAAATGIPAEVVLCLRGHDPSLEALLVALAGQSHRAWRLRVVVDSTTDPAWPVALETLARLGAAGASWAHAVVEPLARRPDTGSLKCAAIRQAIAKLAPATRVIAFVDADAVVSAEWLATLVEACLRPGIGAASGNRWYAPARGTLAGTVRSLWNAGAVVLMTQFGIPWGGSLAIRREALEACGWEDDLVTAFGEDTALAGPLRRAGWRFLSVPALVAVERDDPPALEPLARWIARQTLSARLQHPAWWLVALHGYATAVAQIAATAVCVAAAATGLGAVLAVTGGGIAVYLGGCLAMACAVERAMHAGLEPTGVAFPRTGPGGLAWWCAILPVTQAVYAGALVRATVARSVEWRGVVYDVCRPRGRLGVRLRTDGAVALPLHQRDAGLTEPRAAAS